MSANSKVGFWDIIDSPRRTISIAIIIVIVCVLVAIFGVKIKNAIKKGINNIKTKKEEEKLEETTTQGLDFQSLASKIYNAMRGIGCNVEVVYQALGEIRNNSDYSMLKSKFSVITASSGCKHTDLDWWLADELKSGQEQKARAILDANGVTNYGF